MDQANPLAGFDPQRQLFSALGPGGLGTQVETHSRRTSVPTAVTAFTNSHYSPVCAQSALRVKHWSYRLLGTVRSTANSTFIEAPYH